MATVLEDAGVEWLLEIAGSAAGLERNTAVPSGVEVVRRTNDRDRFTFVLNHSPADVRAVIDAPGTELLTGRPCDATIVVPAGGVSIVRSAAAVS